MKKSELKLEIQDLQERLIIAYNEINNLKLLLKASEIIDDEEEVIFRDKVEAAL